MSDYGPCYPPFVKATSDLELINWTETLTLKNRAVDEVIVLLARYAMPKILV